MKLNSLEKVIFCTLGGQGVCFLILGIVFFSMKKAPEANEPPAEIASETQKVFEVIEGGNFLDKAVITIIEKDGLRFAVARSTNSVSIIQIK